jgi:hypothetical protein
MSHRVTKNRSLGLSRGPVFLLVVLLGLAAGCNPQAEEEAPVSESAPERPITDVMNDHADRIMALDEVVMVAIGELDNGTPCIQVYVKYKSDILAEEIGVEIEGHPVDYIMSDEVRPLN